MSGFWGSRKKEREAQQAQDADLARRAKSALVAADERIRTTRDELAFAVAELGEDLTADLKAAIEAVRTHLGEAFHLHQLAHDEIPDTPEELRTWNTRILQLCEWAEALLDEKTSALQEVVARVRRAPEILAQVRSDADALSERLSPTRATIERLGARYADSAMSQIAASADETEQLLAFARHSADVSERRRTAGRNAEANLALETATEAVRRAQALIEGVEDFEINALRAESTLADVAADSRADLAEARRAPQAPAVAEAATALERALGGLVPRRNDPFAELSTLREANERLEQAVAIARHRAENPPPPREHVVHALDDADRQLGVARSLIAGHRGWIGADARTRLAEAERLRAELAGVPDSEDTREQALHTARRIAQLATEALHLAQRDIDSSRPQQSDWGGWGGGQRGGNGIATGILGGIVIGSILDGLFD